MLPELLHHVFECVGDPATLRQCTIVSKAWRNPAQVHLLSTVFIYPVLDERSISSFLSLLDTRQHLTSSAHDVHIKALPEERFDFRTGELRLEDLNLLLARIPRLRNLYITSVDILPRPQASVPNTPSPYRLDSLRISNSWLHAEDVDCADTFPDILSLFSSIGTLSLASIMLDLPVFGRIDIPPAPPSLVQALTLATYIPSHDLVRSVTVDGLDTLQVRGDQAVANYSEIQKLIDVAADLKCLELWISSGQCPTQTFGRISYSLLGFALVLQQTYQVKAHYYRFNRASS